MYIKCFGKAITKMTQDCPKESCGVFGIFGHPQAAELAYLGMFALQHRGQESAGIVTADGRRLYSQCGAGLVADVFHDHGVFAALHGTSAIGHVRYSTTGSLSALNIQPLMVTTKDGPLAVAHNGNLTNAQELHQQLSDEGAIFQTSSDTELIVHLVARSHEKSLMARIREALEQITGAYSLVFLSPEQLIAARDPHGFRPLVIGKKGEAEVVASETCAFDLTGASYVRDIEPGEILRIDAGGQHSMRFGEPRLAQCIFELIYFARPDSRIWGEPVYRSRRRFGERLSHEAPVPADIVMAVPDSSNTAAVGYARASGLKFDIGLIRNHYIGRTFINPSQFMRAFNTRIKYNPVADVLNGQRVILVEDSIVRGTTLKKLVGLLRHAGAREIHVRVSSPPIQHPCFYGMDFPTRKELIAAWNSEEEIRRFLQVDSLHYLSLDGLLQCAPGDSQNFCTACFSGNYPVPIPPSEGRALIEETGDSWAQMELERLLGGLT
jgi:amidophosphoribosyltransferase